MDADICKCVAMAHTGESVRALIRNLITPLSFATIATQANARRRIPWLDCHPERQQAMVCRSSPGKNQAKPSSYKIIALLPLANPYLLYYSGKQYWQFTPYTSPVFPVS